MRQVPLRVGVVGLGTWGVEHVRGWQAIPGVELVAVCDLDHDHARRLAEPIDTAEAYPTAGDMAASASLDAVSIVNDETDRLARPAGPVTLPMVDSTNICWPAEGSGAGSSARPVRAGAALAGAGGLARRAAQRRGAAREH